MILQIQAVRVMRDEASPTQRRDDMAKAAAPYLRARLSAVESDGPTGQLPSLFEGGARIVGPAVEYRGHMDHRRGGERQGEFRVKGKSRAALTVSRVNT